MSKMRKRYKTDNCNLLNAKPYSGRNTKRNFNKLKFIIGLYGLLNDEKNRTIKNLESRIEKQKKDIADLLELCKEASEAMSISRERIDKEEQTNAYLKDIILEFGDHFDWNDLMFQSTHLKMHLNTNHRIN